MIELFRYIEQSFVRPANKDDSVDLTNDSDFQNKIRSERNQPSAGEKIRRDAQEFIDAHFAESLSGKVGLGNRLLAFHHDVLGLKPPDAANIDQLIAKIFDETAQEITGSNEFRQDKEFLSDSLVAVKLITAYDKVNAADLVAMRQAIEFLTEVAEGKLGELTHEQLRKTLLRPMYIPPSLFPPKATAKTSDGPSGISESDEQQKKIEKLQKEADELKTTYEALMAIRADELEVVALKDTRMAVQEKQSLVRVSEDLNAGVTEVPSRSVVTLSRAVVDKLPDAVKATMKRSNIDVSQTSLPAIVEKVKENWIGVSRELEPYLTPEPINVYQLGIHTFAVQPLAKLTTPSLPVPDFSHAITRPVGIGNLQVVRQELVGYEPGEVSHIENVLEGELYRRATRRSESTDLTITNETETIQTEERDLQTTERNEMATEAQKEASKQTVAAQGQNSTTDYGKLVENSKTNYARSVSDRAVNSLTQKVKEQRVKREQRSYTEKTVHQFDNSKGTSKVRGIYQWVDKKYKMRIMNYGERLLYDVVIPEPAAFLIDSLKNQQQPEAFQLIKPFPPWFFPQDLNTSNYMALARFYGVTGSVQPPPEEFVSTIAEAKNDKVEKVGEVKFYSTKLRIPDGYQAIHGYVTRLTHQAFSEKNLTDDAKNKTGVDLEFMIGEQYLLRFGPGAGSLKFAWEGFTMANEEGELPVLFRSFSPIAEWGFAVGVNCKRVDQGLEKWQLKTFAALTEGYRRQNAEYEDKLSQRQAIVRAQMMLAQNFARNPSVETTELKRMFIHLLVSEHLVQVGFPPPISGPFFFLTDPVYVKKWGAVVAFFERAFEWENIMYFYYPYFYGRLARWGELILIQDLNPQFEEFLKAGAARVVIPVRPGYEAALAHYHETGDVWMGEEMPDMFSDLYVSIIDEIKARNFAPGEELCVAEWDVKLPTTLVMLKDDATLPKWESKVKCGPVDE